MTLVKCFLAVTVLALGLSIAQANDAAAQEGTDITSVDASSTPLDYDGIVPLSELVRKGIISQEQSEYIRSGAIGIEPSVKVKNSKEQLTISGYVQYAYVYNQPHDDALPNPPAVSQFYSQNVILGFDASLVNDWHAVINANFAQGFSSRNYLDGAFIHKYWKDYGAVYLGYKKAQFGLEQYTSSRHIPAVNRSIATRYFTGGYSRIGANNARAYSPVGLGTTGLGMGSRRLGVFWSGKVEPLEGLSYNVEVTNGYSDFNAPANTGSRNQLGYYAGIKYDLDSEIGPSVMREVDVTVGLNTTYQPDGNSYSFGGVDSTNSIWGVDPYVQLEYGNINVIAEFMGANIEKGKASNSTQVTGLNTGDAFAMGGNFFISYIFQERFEPVFRFSILDSDGAGISPSGVVSQGPSFGGQVPGAAPNTISPVGVGFFNSAQAYYLGLNWYILGNDVKLSAGYEHIQFGGRWNGAGFGGPDASEDSIRIRAQVVF